MVGTQNNDILDFSKIEAGKLSLETVTFSLRGSLAQTMKTHTFNSTRSTFQGD